MHVYRMDEGAGLPRQNPHRQMGRKHQWEESTQGMGIEPTAFLLQICQVEKYRKFAAVDFPGTFLISYSALVQNYMYVYIHIFTFTKMHFSTCTFLHK